MEFVSLARLLFAKRVPEYRHGTGWKHRVTKIRPSEASSPVLTPRPSPQLPRRVPREGAIRVLILIFTLLFCTTVQAHTAQVASGLVRIDRSGGVKVTLTIDLPAFLLNDTPVRVTDADMCALLDSPVDALAAQCEDARERLLHSTQLKDGQIESVTLPSVDEIDTQKRQSGAYPFPLMMDVTLAGKMTPGANAFSMRLPEALGQIVLTIDQPDEEPHEFAIEGSDWSPEIPMTATLVASGIARQPTAIPTAPESKNPSVATHSTPIGSWGIALRSVSGILLFVGLFYVCCKLAPLLLRVRPFARCGSSRERARKTPTPRCASEKF